MKSLPILWQRLVNAEGATCPRCANTQQQVDSAVLHLKAALLPLGYEPVLETREISEAAFQTAPAESNASGLPDNLWNTGSKLLLEAAAAVPLVAMLTAEPWKSMAKASMPYLKNC